MRIKFLVFLYPLALLLEDCILLLKLFITPEFIRALIQLVVLDQHAVIVCTNYSNGWMSLPNTISYQ